jgi:hypothetical protein
MPIRVRVIRDVAISENVGGLVCAYPSPWLLDDGTILCTYRQGREKHSRDGVFLVQRSADNGASWSEPIVVYDGRAARRPESVHCGVLCQSRDGTVLALFTAVEAKFPRRYIFSAEGRKLPQRLYASISQDRGQSWQDPFLLDLEFEQPLKNVYVGSRPLVLPDGETLIPIEATNQAGSQIVLVTRSRNSARAVSPVGMCLEDRHGRLSYGDPKWTRLSDGTIVLLAWTFDNITEETVSVSRSISTDNGQSWLAPSTTGLPSQVTTPLTLHSKTILAAGNVRFSAAGIWVWSSRDAGLTWNLTSAVQLWDEKTEQIVGVPGVPKSVCDRDADGIWNSLGSFTFGTPDLLVLDDKRALMTYYATKRSVTHVRACTFEFE